MSLKFYIEHDADRCLLVDGCYETAPPCPAFRSLEEAESFVEYVRDHYGSPVVDLSKSFLDRLREGWDAADKCADCSRVLCEGECPDGCGELDAAAND